MIRVCIFKDTAGLMTGYEISGHADYAPYGKDIVCAAASVLGYTGLKSLIEVAGYKEEQIDYKVDDHKGYLKVLVSLIGDENIRTYTQVIFKIFEVGIKSMIESYPKYITLEYRGGGTNV